MNELSFFDQHPFFRAAAALRHPDSYDVFVNAVHTVLMHSKRELERRVCISLSSENAEDSITDIIQMSLMSLQPCVESGRQNGNADFIFRDINSRYVWIGEAKILDARYSWEHLYQGALQVSTRYSTGSADEAHGGLLIYNYREYAAEVMQEWKGSFFQKVAAEADGFRDCAVVANGCVDFGGFYTSHIHCKSGLSYTLAHIPFNLSHMPIDKSARKSKKVEK